MGCRSDYMIGWTPPVDPHDNPTAELLCKLMQYLESEDIHIPRRIKVKAWWEEHKLRDKKRLEDEIHEIADEQRKKAALAKLSPYERKLLRI